MRVALALLLAGCWRGDAVPEPTSPPEQPVALRYGTYKLHAAHRVTRWATGGGPRPSCGAAERSYLAHPDFDQLELVYAPGEIRVNGAPWTLFDAGSLRTHLGSTLPVLATSAGVANAGVVIELERADGLRARGRLYLVREDAGGTCSDVRILEGFYLGRPSS